MGPMNILYRNMAELGLDITDDGTILANGYAYGHLKDGGYQSMDGAVAVKADELDGIGFADAAYRMTLILKDKSEIPINGTYVGNDDEYEIIDDEVEEPIYPMRDMPKTLSALYDVFPELYPDCDKQLYYNELTEKYVIDLAMIGKKSRVVPLSDTVLRWYRKDIENKLDEHNFVARNGAAYPKESIRDDVLLMYMDEHSRNPFREYVESQVWDGKPRLRMWFRDTFGATAPALNAEDELKYLGDVAQAWFLGAIGRMYGAYRHEIVPVFIGIQGIGKGHALEYTAGRSEFYTTTMVDMTAPGGVKEFLDAVRGRVIVELGEATQFKGNADKMKNFITQTYDQMRKPYKAMDEEYPRHFILASSSNFDNIFTDSSGNRRFFPMYCDENYQTRIFSTEDRSVGQEDVDQLWAEALYMFQHDQKAFIYGEAEKRAEAMQHYCTSENTNISIIQDWLDDPMNGYTNVGALVNKDIIMRELFGYTTKAQQLNKDANIAFSSWTNNMTSGIWKKREGISLNGGKPGRAYERILAPGDTGESRSKFLMVPTKSADMSEIIAMSAIRKLTRDYSLKVEDVIPQEAIDGLEDLPLLLRMGFIYTETEPDGTDVYHVGFYKEP